MIPRPEPGVLVRRGSGTRKLRRCPSRPANNASVPQWYFHGNRDSICMSASGDDLFCLRKKTILVTGGTRGIGQAISLRFARAGATVIANYLRNEHAAEQLKAIAAEERLAITLCRADLTSERGLEQLDHGLQEVGPGLSGLVHCAATGIHRPLEELTERHFDWTFNLNVRAFFRVIKLVKPRLSIGSSVVAVSSWGAAPAHRARSLTIHWWVHPKARSMRWRGTWQQNWRRRAFASTY